MSQVTQTYSTPWTTSEKVSAGCYVVLGAISITLIVLSILGSTNSNLYMGKLPLSDRNVISINRAIGSVILIGLMIFAVHRQAKKTSHSTTQPSSLTSQHPPSVHSSSVPNIPSNAPIPLTHPQTPSTIVPSTRPNIKDKPKRGPFKHFLTAKSYLEAITQKDPIYLKQYDGCNLLGLCTEVDDTELVYIIDDFDHMCTGCEFENQMYDRIFQHAKPENQEALYKILFAMPANKLISDSLVGIFPPQRWVKKFIEENCNDLVLKIIERLDDNSTYFNTDSANNILLMATQSETGLYKSIKEKFGQKVSEPRDHVRVSKVLPAMVRYIMAEDDISPALEGEEKSEAANLQAKWKKTVIRCSKGVTRGSQLFARILLFSDDVLNQPPEIAFSLQKERAFERFIEQVPRLISMGASSSIGSLTPEWEYGANSNTCLGHICVQIRHHQKSKVVSLVATLLQAQKEKLGLIEFSNLRQDYTPIKKNIEEFFISDIAGIIKSYHTECPAEGSLIQAILSILNEKRTGKEFITFDDLLQTELLTLNPSEEDS